MRTKSDRAAATLRWQNAKFMPVSTASAIATPRFAGSRPMMWRTRTSLPKMPGWLTVWLSWLKPTSVARTASRAVCGCSRLTFKSRNRTSKAGSPSNSITKLPSQAVILRVLEPLAVKGWQPWETRESSNTSSLNATPLRPPANTPLAAPWPLILPSLDTENCTLLLRLAAKPPNR